MFGRKQQTQLAKNIVAESERVIKLGEDAASRSVLRPGPSSIASRARSSWIEVMCA